MLKRLFIIWLIICSLGYGVAWAFDSHVDETHAATPDSAASPVDNTHRDEHPTCDHCCHVSVHFLALWHSIVVTTTVHKSIIFQPYQVSAYHFLPNLSDRPPRI